MVRLQNVAVHPARLVVHRGDRVTWEFLDGASAPHTVTSYSHRGGRRFHGLQSADQERASGSFSVTFSRAGTYYYMCLIHPGMLGRIVVR